MPRFTFSEDTCHNEQVLFTNRSILTNGKPLPSRTKYTWDFGNGSPISKDVSPSHVFKNPFHDKDVEYYITLTIELNGCSKFLTDTIIVHPQPKVDFKVENACGADTIRTENKSIGKGILTYAWSAAPNSGIAFINSNSENPKIVITDPKKEDIEYKITLQVTSEDGCDTSLTKPLIIYGEPTATINAKKIICKDSLETFESIAPPVSSALAPDSFYVWTYGDKSRLSSILAITDEMVG